MVATWGLTNRGSKTANFYVITYGSAPSVLHELAFVTNARDAAVLRDPTQRQQAAGALMRTLAADLGVTPALHNPDGSTPTAERGTVSGRVLLNGVPLVGAQVFISCAASTTTSGDGSFVFTDIAEGTWLVIAQGAETSTGRLSDEVPVEVLGGQTAVAELALRPEGAGRYLVARVLNAATDVPVLGSHLMLGGEQTTTGAAGIAAARVPAGVGNVTAVAEGFVPRSHPLAASNRCNLVELKLTPTAGDAPAPSDPLPGGEERPADGGSCGVGSAGPTSAPTNLQVALLGLAAILLFRRRSRRTNGRHKSCF
jgi:MYXO-CTERM domain-containing protein